MFKKLTFGSKGGEELQVDHIIPYTGWEQYISELFETGKLNLQSAMELFNQEDWRFEKSELLKPENALAAEAEAKRVAVSFINRLGNCSLLNWKYNDSKNRSNLGDFLGNVYEVKAGNNDKEFLTHWSEAMYLTPEFLHPFTKESGYRESRFSIKEFVNAIRHREEKICKDLRAFIKAENGDEKLF